MLKVLAARDLCEADQSVHQGELSRIVELETGDAFAGRGEGGFGELSELPAIDKRFEDILLDIQVIVDDVGHLVTQRRKMLDSLVYTVVGDVVTGRLGTEDDVVTHVLLDEAIAIVTADNWVGQVHVFDLGLQLAAVLFRDLATKDDGDLVWLTDGAVGVEEPLPQFVEGGPPMKDQVVAEFDLREEQPMLATRLFALCLSEKRSEAGQPFTAATC